MHRASLPSQACGIRTDVTLLRVLAGSTILNLLFIHIQRDPSLTWHYICCTDVGESLDLLPELTKLNMNGCVSLTRLVLTSCTKLEWLDCSGCALMHHIHAFSPALSHVRAVACHRLVVSLAAALCSCAYGRVDCWCQDSIRQMYTQSIGGCLEHWNIVCFGLFQ